MDMHGFITTVERVGDIRGDQEAERVACVTLEALSRRISVGEARELAARLPEGLRSCIRPVDPQEKFHFDEFLRRIAEPLGLDRSVAEREARAVLAAIFRAVGPDEFADMRSELPKDFGPLLDEAVATAAPDGQRSPAGMSCDEFLSRVEERTLLQRTEARRAVEAVLETLAYRITGRAIDQIEQLLPPELWPALERGRMRSGGKAVPLGVEEFVRQVQKLVGEHIARDEALRYARAVMQTLREAIGDGAFRELINDLPDQYMLLVPHGWDDAPVTNVAHQLTVDLTSFLATVQRVGELRDPELAERAACQVLRSLARRISVGEAGDLAERLPDELRPCIEPDGPRETFGVEGLVRAVADELALDRVAAEKAVCGVLAALFTVSGPDEFADLRSELPNDFEPLLDRAAVEAPGPNPQPPESAPGMSYEEFLAEIAVRGARERDIARQAADAVLEVLAMRITGGQLDDIAPLLPREFRPALERGRARGGGRARPLSLEEFLREVQRLEGVTRDIAFRHARAVFLTLRQALGEKEFHDTMAQLPTEYHQLLRPE
ncbi:MAG: hypothetical protein QOJ19_1040 [Acidimicrobiia bacterium]|nr:hypothetical protein [Acidimicrobiia bacterium]